MSKKAIAIPINTMDDHIGGGIAIEKMFFKDMPIADSAFSSNFGEARLAHRHDAHSFFLLESGTIQIEIDFQKYSFKSPSVIYMHPDQVHRVMAFENVTVSSWAINNENLNPEYLKLLEEITPVQAIMLAETTFSIFSEAVSIVIRFSERKNDKLYHSLLKDGCNMLVALVISQYLELAKSIDKSSRFEIVTKAFKKLLERNYTKLKRPAAYAKQLNISTPYLNECVKNTTGFSVSYHIQQRIILEAKRLLYHSNISVKEIVAALGYDDYPYFSRLFTKVVGMSALAFRNKNLD